jgi:transposase-like protein
LETKPSNGVTPGKAARSRDREVLEKPKRRRFTTEDKLRILRDADACAPGTVGAVLRREGIYSSHLAAWRQARDRGDFDTTSLRKRAKGKVDVQTSKRRIADLERENRKLHRRLERAELILDIQKKAQGLLLELESPEKTESER